MVKAVALNTVHLCKTPGERSPEGKTIKRAEIEAKAPGTIFDVDKKQLDDLVARGVARPATKVDLVRADESSQMDLG
ncbi:MAG: hypothetical protein E5V95_13685 [Mesorhizobium sp.]|uniref:hypothetical protein n=2 Tax=Mesorhizobium TaxID=68287 RepID=UPI000F7597D9|nr:MULTISPECIES: hypothetical protein [unclassified Mesorhizobium]RVC60864.1 hypothetical protein EN759_30220 [Mesorhizobium sp. M00.F.Ca.ET.038.03.1.1]RVC70469.1 hypothetical protein EN766_27980 [Mesorhizobium sp. M2A.F.Ca.ET.046.02.1.1]AZO38762.1 hypothetical protein EJ072_33120 [Mesorhizobium sp. M2A.F.Ca.ET.046.03.2.1]RWA87910.1 MAG: hypothetical protein EOQ31_23145 [Mesorhizobium sp.]RWB43605.1 MAG: hypothetical protein EOQ44_18270 [Mesorhizobium sp.]